MNTDTEREILDRLSDIEQHPALSIPPLPINEQTAPAVDAEPVIHAQEPEPTECVESKLIDAWCLEHGGKISWHKAIEIVAILQHLSAEETHRMLQLDDETWEERSVKLSAARQSGINEGLRMAAEESRDFDGCSAEYIRNAILALIKE